jgi:tetratricopeptide (TPR) repeat protein
LTEAADELRRSGAIWDSLAADFPAVPLYRFGQARHNLNLGNLLKKRGMAAQAEKEWCRGVALWKGLAAEFPSDSEYPVGLGGTYCNLGGLALTQGRPADALPWLNQAVAVLTPVTEREPWAQARQYLFNSHILRAQTLQKQGQFAEAIADCREAVKLNPKITFAHRLLGLYLATATDRRLRDPKRAVASAKKALELAPADPSNWHTLGMAYYARGAYRAAVHAMIRAQRGDGTTFFFLAMSHWQLGHKDTAGEYFQKAVRWMDRFQPRNVELRRFRAEAAALLGITDNPKKSDKGKPAKMAGD